jgi:hypothetical protein
MSTEPFAQFEQHGPLMQAQEGMAVYDSKEAAMLHGVQDLQGNTLMATDGAIGTPKDVYFDDETWIVRYLVADTGGWLTGRRVLIAVVALGTGAWHAGELAVALTRDQIRHSPDIDTDKPISRQHEAAYHRYYGYPYYWGGMGMGMYPLAMPVPDAPAPEAEGREKDDMHLRSMREVTGYAIHARDGALGHVADFLVDDADWAIRWAVVSTGNWLRGGRQVLVSPGWITAVRWERREVAVDLDRATIEHGPAFDPAAPVDREYETRLYGYYGRPGYWR